VQERKLPRDEVKRKVAAALDLAGPAELAAREFPGATLRLFICRLPCIHASSEAGYRSLCLLVRTHPSRECAF